MNIRSKNMLFIAALLFAAIACQSAGGGSQPAVEEEAASQESGTAPEVEPSTVSEAPAQTETMYDGTWSGTNSDGSDIVFEITDGQLTSVTINYQADNNGCTFSGAVSMGIDPSPIQDDAFLAEFTAPNDYIYTFAGTLDSDAEASGTIHVKSPSTGMCGEFDKDLTWNAGKGSDSDGDAGDTEDSIGTSDVDEIAVVTEFFDAANAGDLDSALALVDDNVMFSFGTNATQFGRDNLEAFLSSSNVTYQISDTESFGGGMAQFTATASDGTTYTFCTALFQDGKIVSLTLQP